MLNSAIMNAITTLPPPEVVIAQIHECHEELRALKRLLRASEAAIKAKEAQQRRARAATKRQEVACGD